MKQHDGQTLWRTRMLAYGIYETSSFSRYNISSQSGVRGPPGGEKIGVWGSVKWHKIQDIKSDGLFENMSAVKQ